MNTSFLRLGSRLINVASICDVELEDHRLEHPEPVYNVNGARYFTEGPLWRRPCVTITLAVQQGIDGTDGGTEARSFAFYDDDAESIRSLFLHKSWLATLGSTVVDVVHLHLSEQFKREYGR